MNLTKRLAAIRASVALAAITLSLAVCAQAQTFTTLVNFDGSDGSYASLGAMVQGTDGNFYGTTQDGGTHSGGVFFRMTPSGVITDLYNFCFPTKTHQCPDGGLPYTTPVLGTDGNFYGTTSAGGSGNGGTIYKMTPAGVITTLYSFCPTSACEDGHNPTAMMQASNGKFYGVTFNYGPNSNGTIFELSSAGVFKVLYSFCPQSNCANGGNDAYAGLMQAKNGNLYGTTFTGGTYNNGTVYEISTTGQFRTIYNFCAETLCPDGASPQAKLVQDAHGNLYGTTYYGGANAFGSIFEITTAGQFILLHSFDNTDGSYPTSALTLASDGNLYGMTSGSDTFGGTVFEFTAAQQFTSLYSFCTQTTCTGSNPLGSLLQGTNGILYGMTNDQGTDNSGTIFSLTTGLPPLVETVPTAGKVGAHVIILGNSLAGATAVSFNGTAASFTVVSNTEITATVPAGATTGKITVRTGTRTLRGNPAFQVLP